METAKFILKCLFTIIPDSYFYSIEYTNYEASVQGVYDREVVAYFLSLGAIFERRGRFITLQFKGLRMVFDY